MRRGSGKNGALDRVGEDGRDNSEVRMPTPTPQGVGVGGRWMAWESFKTQREQRRAEIPPTGTCIYILESVIIAFPVKETMCIKIRGAWVAQLVERPTSAQVMVLQFMSSSPTSGCVLTNSSEPGACFRFSPPPPPLLMLCLSLSLKNQ